MVWRDKTDKGLFVHIQVLSKYLVAYVEMRGLRTLYTSINYDAHDYPCTVQVYLLEQ